MGSPDARRWLDLARSLEYSVWENRVDPASGNERPIRVPESRSGGSPSFQLSWSEACRDLSTAPYVAGSTSHRRLDRILPSGGGRLRVPHRLDSADYGNEMVWAAVGSWGTEDRPDLSRHIKLCGPDKREIPVSPPHYDLPGGSRYRPIGASKLILYGCDGMLFRDMERQRQRRVRDAPVWVTEVESRGRRITIIDFAPAAPSLSLVCRVWLTQGGAGSPRIHQVFAGRDWRHERCGDSHLFMDHGDGTGVMVRASRPLDLGPAAVAGEAGWVDATVALGDATGDGVAAAWTVLVPWARGGDPLQTAAAAALDGFDPWTGLVSTLGWWKDWSAEVRFRCDEPLMEDLVNGLALLLKVHEGRHGLHLGTTYQRHTHCWTRDNYHMQRGLWAAGRKTEAARDVQAFAAYCREGGTALGYHVASRRPWAPQVTTELSSYLVLMAREAHRNTGVPPAGDVLDMVRAAAEAISLNKWGLAGFDGDEAWIWELDPRLFEAREAEGFNLRSSRLNPADFSVLDNCWLALAALRYAARLEGSKGDPAAAARWTRKADGIAARVEELLWDPSKGRYTALLLPDGRRYDGELVSGLCTPWYWDLPEARPGAWAEGVRACERALMTPEGILRGNRDTDVFAGLTPSLHLHALGSLGGGLPFDRALDALIRSLPSSGACWEYATFDCPITGTDKRRGLDSGVLLTALLNATVGPWVDDEALRLRPRLPAMCRFFSLGEMSVRGRSLRLDVSTDGAQVTWDGKRHDLGPLESLVLPFGS